VSRRRRNGYAGAYVDDIAAQVVAAVPGAPDMAPAERDEVFRRIGVNLMFDEIKQALHSFGTDFDVWFHEQSLHESGAVEPW